MVGLGRRYQAYTAPVGPLLLLAGLAALAGCDGRDPDTLLAQGERLILVGQWHEAIRPLKQCLLLDPHNIGAHFYLGRAYLNARFGNSVPPWRLSIAVGELETALWIFQSNGKPEVLDRYTPAEFEVMCHVLQAWAHLRKIEFAIGAGVPPRALVPLLQEVERETDAARNVMPDSKDVNVLDEFITKFKDAGVVPGAAPPAPPALVAPSDNRETPGPI